MKATRASLGRFGLQAGLVLLVLVVLVWSMALRENSSRRLNLEFSAYRVSTRLVEDYLQAPESLRVPKEVQALGIYSPSGKSLYRSGTAPETLDVPRTYALSFDHEERSGAVILTRPFGLGEGFDNDLPMMRRMGGGRGMGMLSPNAPPPDPPIPGQGPRGQTRFLWMEYGASGVSRANALTLGAAIIVTLGLLVLYLVLLRLYGRNRELREREASNRELLQLGEAARTLVHEIKNPLAVIRIQTATIRRTATPELAYKVGIIDEEVSRLASLSDRIREYLKGGKGEARLVDLGGFLREYAARYEGSPSLPPLVLGPVPAGAFVVMDPDKLSQCLDNLVSNAMDASPTGATVDLAVEARGKTWEVAVGDRGPGVAEENRGRLFEPFFTTKEKGSGIGLALARRIAEASGGDLDYSPRQGGGARFILSLPKAPGP